GGVASERALRADQHLGRAALPWSAPGPGLPVAADRGRVLGGLGAARGRLRPSPPPRRGPAALPVLGRRDRGRRRRRRTVGRSAPAGPRRSLPGALPRAARAAGPWAQ